MKLTDDFLYPLGTASTSIAASAFAVYDCYDNLNARLGTFNETDWQSLLTDVPDVMLAASDITQKVLTYYSDNLPIWVCCGSLTINALKVIGCSTNGIHYFLAVADNYFIIISLKIALDYFDTSYWEFQNGDRGNFSVLISKTFVDFDVYEDSVAKSYEWAWFILR